MVGMFLGKLVSFINRYKFSLLFFALLMILGHLLNGKLLFIIINIASLFFLFNIVAKTKYTFVITGLLVLFLTADVVYYILYSSSIYVGIFSSILETTPIEAKEMLGNTWATVICSLVIISGLCFLSLRELKRGGLKRRLSLILFLVINILLIPSYLALNIYRNQDVQAQALFKESPVLFGQTVISAKFPIVYNDIAILFVYSLERYKISRFRGVQKQMPEGIVFDSKHEPVERIYLIIGESSFRGHYSLYGYAEKTTPFLDSLKLNTNTLNYYEAISPACITRDAIRFSLSFASPLDKDAFFSYKNIIDIAKDQGYETIWLSNQERVGSFDNYTGILASTADRAIFETEHELYRNDLSLLDRLEQCSEPGKKQFIIIHLIGSHMPYEYRFDDVDVLAINTDNSAHIVNYDRSIHYTDRVLKGIYGYSLKNDAKSLLYYFSDHGECVGLGHGQMFGGKDQYQIPLIVMNNNSSIPVDSIVEKYKIADSGLINSCSSIYILSEILGYNVGSSLVEKAQNDSKYVFHIDGQVYFYDDIKQK